MGLCAGLLSVGTSLLTEEFLNHDIESSLRAAEVDVLLAKVPTSSSHESDPAVVGAAPVSKASQIREPRNNVSAHEHGVSHQP